MSTPSFKCLYLVLGILLLCTGHVSARTHADARIMFSADIDDPLVFIAGRIKLFEGFHPERYGDGVTKGVILQGYGRSIRGQSPARISRSTADAWLQSDLAKCQRHLDQHLPWWRRLSAVRQAAMLDLTYNLGIDKLKTFRRFLHSMQSGHYTAAASHLMVTDGRKSRYARQVGVRAKEVSSAIATDKWVAMKR